MSRNDVARSLELLEDDTIAAAVASHDLTALPGGLDPEEAALVVAAAADRPPEVAGYAISGLRPPPGSGLGFKPGSAWDIASRYAAGTTDPSADTTGVRAGTSGNGI